MRVVALIASYNERRFIEACLDHLDRHGVDAYLIDNCSTDATVELAERWLDRNLIGIETFPRGEDDVYDWRGLLQRKEQLAAELEADWFMHLDPDEIRLPPPGDATTLREAFEAVDREGFNAVDFAEFTFVPTCEHPDHDHPRFQETMRAYYAHGGAGSPHQLKAWKAQPEVKLANGGHRVRFPGQRVYPQQFRMKHYLALSVPHAIEKYVERRYDPDEVESGWHGWRASVEAEKIELRSESELLINESDDDLDPREPYIRHFTDWRHGKGDTRIPKSDVAAWLRRCVRTGNPMAIVRFGDGEARVLEADRNDAKSLKVASHTLESQSDRSYSVDEIMEISRNVWTAFNRADALGLLNDVGSPGPWSKRLLGLYEKDREGGRPRAMLSGQMLHQHVLADLPEILAGRKVSAVSCRDLGPVLEDEWGLDDVRIYQVPSQAAVRDVDGPYEAAMYGVPIWPDAIARVRSELTVREPGEVSLVGAGVFGKGLCIDIRERGGIAIDMGSALDNIAGKRTRGPQRRALELRAGGLEVDEVAARLSEVAGTEVDSETVSSGLEAIAEEVEVRRRWLEREKPRTREADSGTLQSVSEAEVDLGERRARLGGELSDAHRERRRLERRLTGLDRELARRDDLIESLEADVARTTESRSFRYGHGALSRFSRWVLRRPARRSGLDEAAELLRRGWEDLDRVRPAGSADASGRRGGQGNGSFAPGATATKPVRAAEPEGRKGPTSPSGPAERERATREGFRARYEALFQGKDGAVELERLALPVPRDRGGVLLGAAGDSEPAHPGVDVVVCVRDAPEDVRLCLWSLMHSSTRPFHLIVVDDGSGPETAAMLDELAAREPELELLRNEGPEHGYTRAANIGLRASTGAHVVLLNSDTIVSPGWLERIVECAESDQGIGVVGPLSNAATHQSVPAVKADGRWAVNELPAWLTVDSMAELVAGLSDRERPRLPFLNGFCYAITREAIERVGRFDEERFGSGYCEENDFSIRAQDAGFSLAVADDAYVFHRKSRSYSADGRDEIARPNYRVFLDKHGAERVDGMLAELDEAAALRGLREATAAAVGDEEATIRGFRAANPEPLSILFVLHGMPEGSGGGVHSVYQETAGLRRLGAPARIAIAADGMERARAAYPDADDVFVPYAEEAELARHATSADVVVATHYITVALVKRLHERYGGFRPAYYVQDYEPFFAEPGSAQLVEALDSYTAIPEQLVFAKTHWLRNLIGHLHGVDVAKVEPSLDREVYSVAGRKERDRGPVRVAAMLRPRTPRRQPVLTLDVLSALVAEHGDRVQVTTFGCPVEAAEALPGKPPGPHLGLLSRHHVADLLRRTDVFLDASTYQAFGRTALEAMACGCTAVAPAIGGAGQFIDDGENGFLVDTFSPDPAVAAVGRLVEDGDLLRNLQAAAVEEAGRHSILRSGLSEYALFARDR